MKHAPDAFSGSWLDFYAEYVQPNLVPANTVARVHEWMKQYCREVDAKFPVRYVTGTERRRQYMTTDGTCIIPCDNAPAWELHAQLLRGEIDSYATFRRCVPMLPRHFHDVAAHETISRYGWYVAHIFPAKNRDTDYRAWRRPEAERRFLTALHPCNIFFVPRIRGRQLGENSRVISFFADQYACRYASVWTDFLDCVRVHPLSVDPGFGSQLLDIHSEADVLSSRSDTPPLATAIPAAEPKATYYATRLLFRKSKIEAIDWDESFEIQTPAGIFRLTKREFYSEFPNVVASLSYSQRGVYHSASLPARAKRFRIQ